MNNTTNSQESVRERFYKEFVSDAGDMKCVSPLATLPNMADFWLEEIKRVVREDERPIIPRDDIEIGINQERSRIRKAFNIE